MLLRIVDVNRFHELRIVSAKDELKAPFGPSLPFASVDLACDFHPA